MKKTIFALIAVVAVLTGCKKEETYDPENVAVTSDVLLVTETSATIQGIAHLTTYDLRFYGHFGVEICTDNLFDETKKDADGNPTMMIAYKWAPLKGKIDDEGRFTVDFSNLKPGTLYYYRTAVNYNSIGLPEGNHCFRGETRTFRTKSLPE